MPVEFSVAAYRLGHSMIRPGYRLNDDNLLSDLPRADQDFADRLRDLNSIRGLDWARSIDIESRS